MIKAYWQAVARQNEALLPDFFNADAVVHWHNTNEAFDVAGFVRANCDYPGNWQGEIERIEEMGDLLITVTRVWDEARNSSHVCAFIKLENGKISRVDEYWGDDGKAPEWRKALGISQPIKKTNTIPKPTLLKRGSFSSPLHLFQLGCYSDAVKLIYAH